MDEIVHVGNLVARMMVLGKCDMNLRKLATSCLLLCVPLMLSARGRTSTHEMASARKFVQAFYDWYAPRAVKDLSLESVLKKKPSLFTPVLAQALKEDLVAESKSNGDLVGLDFDPFLNSQDPVSHYKVVLVDRAAKGYRVTVKSVATPEMKYIATVVAEVVKVKGGWRFSNFRYPEDSDLLTQLKELKRSRATASR